MFEAQRKVVRLTDSTATVRLCFPASFAKPADAGTAPERGWHELRLSAGLDTAGTLPQTGEGRVMASVRRMVVHPPLSFAFLATFWHMVLALRASPG